MLDLTIDFNQIISAVYLLAAAVAVISLLLVLQVMWMRRMGRAHERRTLAVGNLWTPILQSPEQYYANLPRVHSKDVLTFLMLWNAAQQNGANRQELNRIANSLGMDGKALELIQKRDIAARLVGFETLGHLGDPSIAPILRVGVDSSNPVLSFAAARTLLKIDRSFARTFVTLMIRHSDWSPVRLQALVEEESDVLAAPITKLVRASSTVSHDLVQYLRFFDPTLTRPVVCHVLATSADPETIVSALKVLAVIGTPSDAALAATFAAHDDWRVRVQAANALGRLGDASQLDLVVSLLSDAHWWVRFRAAQAIAALHTGGDEQLRFILEGMKDRFGRDMLAQIIAERQPAHVGA